MFLSSLATGFQLSPASALRNSPSRIAANITFGFSGFTANPFTVRRVGRPPTGFHPQKQSGFRRSPSAVPAIAAPARAPPGRMKLRRLVGVQGEPVDVQAADSGVRRRPRVSAVL